MTPAEITLHQLGGNRFLVMTGAQASRDGNHLLLKLPIASGSWTPKNKAKIKAVRITLEASDTYTMIFYHQKGPPTHEVTEVARHEMVYAEDLQRLFTETTGLQTHL